MVAEQGYMPDVQEKSLPAPAPASTQERRSTEKEPTLPQSKGINGLVEQLRDNITDHEIRIGILEDNQDAQNHSITVQLISLSNQISEFKAEIDMKIQNLEKLTSNLDQRLNLFREPSA